VFLCPIEIGPRDGSRFQRVISVNGSENIYSVLFSTLLDILGVGTEWESRFTLPGGEWEMLPMAEVRMRSTARPTASPSLAARHTLAAFGLAAGHDEQKLVQADMFLS